MTVFIKGISNSEAIDVIQSINLSKKTVKL